jgi:hypothetical protein
MHCMPVRPCIEHLAFELRAVIHSDRLRETSSLREPLEHCFTRVPVSEVSTSIATHSRVQSSTMFRHRSRLRQPGRR